MSGIPTGAGSLLGKRLGKYEILALLALGGTAEIYLARIGGAAGFEKYVVVKCLHDHLADDMEFVKMFLDEARLAAHLDHSNIVQTMELGEQNNRYYMVMEFLGGLSLAMVVRRLPERAAGGKMPVPLTLNIMAQACAGLHYAHERAINGKVLNIVHRDISPQNLVISFEGVVKVVDFGIAKAEMRETSTRSGTIKGKFAYMSPEQCVANNVDRRTDVFALGVIAHELLTGGRLFKRNSPYETYQAVIDCVVPPPSKLNVELDPAIDPIIMRALAKDKENRYPTAEAFGDALAGYLHHRGKGSGPGEVSRYFESHFNQELEEHGQRMRELIEGRADSVDQAASWGNEEEAERERKRSDHTVDLSGRGSAGSISVALNTQDIDILTTNRGSAGSLSDVISDLGSGGDDDDLPPDRTRIESNPLDLVQQHEAAAPVRKNTPAPVSVAAVKAATRASATKTQMPVPQVLAEAPSRPSGPLPLPPAPSGKFPNSANLATQIHDDALPRPAEQKTQIASLLMVDPAINQTKEAPAYRTPLVDRTKEAPPYAANRPTALPTNAVRPEQPTQPPPMLGPPSASHQAQMQPASVEVRPSLYSQPLQRSAQQPLPASYPVLNAQLASEVPPHAQHLPQVQAAMQRGDQPQYGQMPAQMGAQTGARPGQMSAQLGAQPGQMSAPMSAQPIQGQPNSPYAQRAPESGVFVSGPTVPPQQGPGFDAHRAAGMASPVGAGYPQQDWNTAAAKPARAVPPWMFAILFVLGFGAALAITILIAKAVH